MTERVRGLRKYAFDTENHVTTPVIPILDFRISPPDHPRKDYGLSVENKDLASGLIAVALMPLGGCCLSEAP